jgi:dihydrofolate reductase
VSDAPWTTSEQPEQKVGQQHSFGCQQGILVVDGAMADRVLEGTDGSSEEGAHCLALTRLGVEIGERTGVGIKGRPHELDAEVTSVGSGSRADILFDGAKGCEDGFLVVTGEELALGLVELGQEIDFETRRSMEPCESHLQCTFALLGDTAGVCGRLVEASGNEGMGIQPCPGIEFCKFTAEPMSRGPPAGSTLTTLDGGGTMGKVIASITTSVDGYVTGPDDGPDYGLGRGGERLHYWVMGGPWTYEGGHDFAMHGPDKEFYDELISTVASGVVGRGMYDAAGAWRGTNPFPGTLFVLTHRAADQPAAESGFRFVADLDAALAQAAEAAGDGDVAIGGGADVIRRALAADKVDELVISTAPVILGAGKRLFDGFDRDVDLEVAKVYSSPCATHVRDMVTK